MSPIPYSSTGKRILATVVDYSIIFGFFFWFVFSFGAPNADEVTEVKGMPALIPVGFWLCYLILPEGLTGQTLGHSLAGIKVTRLDGGPVHFSQALRRHLADVVEITWCFGLIAFVLVKNNTHHQRLGDI